MRTQTDSFQLLSEKSEHILLIKKLFSYTLQPTLFFIFFTIFYLFTPTILYFFFDANEYMLLLAKISIIALLGLFTGYYLLSKWIQISPAHVFNINCKHFLFFVFSFFVLLVLLIIFTTESVPLFTALNTRDVYEIGISRAYFLKAREGIEGLFVYASVFFTTSFLPYLIMLSFVRNYSFRWFVFAFPYLYSFLLVEKVFFLRFSLPMLSFFSIDASRKQNNKKFFFMLISIPFVIYINTMISGIGSPDAKLAIQKKFEIQRFEIQKLVIQKELEIQKKIEIKKLQIQQSEAQDLEIFKLDLQKLEKQQLEKQKQEEYNRAYWSKISNTCGNFYSAQYVLCASIDRVKFLVWRIIAVPVFSATDSLKLFEKQYHGRLLFGRTSSFISFVLGFQNIKFEREVFLSEWGQDSTGTSSSNAVYIIEQFINFGWFGVLFSSMLIGYMFAVLRRSTDLALASLSLVISLSLFLGGFISNMLSGGYLALFSFLFLTKLEE